MDQRSNAIETVTLEIEQGLLAGLRSGDVCEFRGIPFAEPPVGAARWHMPQQASAWAGVRDATRFAAVCPQAPTPIDSLLGGSLSLQSEGCLYLNVWTPGWNGTRLPVMVWIHGGAFVIGAGSQSIYNGAHLASRGVVLVTINYRLGVFGFLNLARAAKGSATGTEGLADQLMALDWVRRNIAAFGGDPENITVFGESAGAMSIAALLASPQAGRLFHRAIIQSGSAHIGHADGRSQRLALAVLDALSISQEYAGRLADVPTASLVKAQVALLASTHGGKDLQKLGRLPFQPTIGDSLLSARPIEAIRQGSARNIPLLCGTTRDEWKLFTAFDPRIRLMSVGEFEARLTRTMGDAAPALREVYSDGSAFERFNAYMTDRLFAVPTARLLEAQSRFAPVYAYRFDWRSRLFGGFFGACHALELGFVFGTHASGAAAAFFGKGAAADALARSMMECWVAFARSGDPTTPASGSWPRYDSRERSTMILGSKPARVVIAPDRERIEAWDAVPEQKLQP